MKAVRAVNGGDFVYQPPDGIPAVRIPVLAASGPLCVARAYSHHQRELRSDLFWIYVPSLGGHIGPYFAEIPAAQRAMQKILKQVGPKFFEQPIAWIKRQHVFGEWLHSTIGAPADLVGGEWMRE